MWHLDFYKPSFEFSGKIWATPDDPEEMVLKIIPER